MVDPTVGNGAPPWVDDATNARFTHYDRLPLHAMVGLDPDLATVLDAHFIGCTPERLRDIRSDQARTVSATAASLLADEEFAERLHRMAAVTGPRIVVLGDSIAADSLGWAELLKACVDTAGQQEGVGLTNIAVSGFTTSETIPLFDLVVRERPTCVLAMLGTNDGRRQGAVADVRTVSTVETQRNLHALRTLTQRESNARFVGVTPPPMNQALYDASALAGAPVRFNVDDLAATLDAIRLALPDVIDVPALLDDDLPTDFWLPDGLHPSERGQVVLLRHIVYALAQLPGG
jgi:acyl-CoA thioesterase-1